jgi:hypothetical protein
MHLDGCVACPKPVSEYNLSCDYDCYDVTTQVRRTFVTESGWFDV